MLSTHVTDTGTRIPARHWREGQAGDPSGPEGYRSLSGLESILRRYAEAGVDLDRCVPTSPINPNFNCHGYTFTRNHEGGWLPGRLVDQILADNGFRKIRQMDALPGDVLIYRNKADAVENAGAVVHSGVVEHVTSDGVYANSKFGAFAVMRHDVNELTPLYQADIEFYHTDRPGGRFLTRVDGTSIESGWSSVLAGESPF
ncbi:hypothetical protein ACFZC5_34445 [Nocardia gamkensis]|uniref:hypothetical protein n=1 Tax=Nocardia gamkensis TaxID=352869 RepID=UPI0036E6B7B7